MVGNLNGGSTHNVLPENRLKDYGPGQLLFGHDIIIPIKHTVD